MQRIMWWNIYNLFDDIDDPDVDDMQRSRREYMRDVSEIASVFGSLHPLANLIGLGELENRRVLDDLIQELRWHKRHPDYRCPAYIDSRDPRGIDVGCLVHYQTALKVDRVSAIYPSDPEAVRPVLYLQARINQDPIHFVFLHSKSQRSGPTHHRDPNPGSRIRFAYAHLIRKIAVDTGSQGIGLVVMGDFNETPQSPSLQYAANAWNGRPQRPHQLKDNRLYNITQEMRADAKGTHCYHGQWNFLDQVLVNGALLRPGGIEIIGRPHVLTHEPLLYRGEPNRWYSDHLPIYLTLGHQQS